MGRVTGKLFIDDGHWIPARSGLLLAGALAIIAGLRCAAPAPPMPIVPDQAYFVAASRPYSDQAASPDAGPTRPVTIRLDGVDLLSIRYAALLDARGEPTDCQIVSRSPASRPAGGQSILLDLVPVDRSLPTVQLELTQTGNEARLDILSPDKPPLVQLVIDTLFPMMPVCLAPREPDRILHAALGPVCGDWFDGLFDADHDWAVGIEGRVFCQELPHTVRMTVVPGYAGGKNEPHLLSLRLEKDYLKKHHRLRGYAPIGRYRLEPMPAAWMPFDSSPPPTADEVTRNTVWMAVNLKPYGAASVLVRQSGSLIHASARPGAARQAGTAAVGARAEGLSFPTAWKLLQSTASDIAARFWSLGVIAEGTSSTIVVGEPLSLSQATLFASLLGLSGHSAIAGERMYLLEDERVDLLRRTIPAAPIRTVDLFTHRACPPVWDLSVNTDAGSWHVLGLMNLSDEPRLESIELEDLHLGDGTEQFAVYDLWNRRLLRCVTDRFQLWVPATGCRVLAISRITPAEPTLLGTSRHLTGGGTDLHDVHWDVRSLTLTGRSDVVENDPYELPIYLPEGDGSVELLQVQCAVSSGSGLQAGSVGPVVRTHLRSADQVRTIVFESDRTCSVDWQIRFERVNQPLQPPPLPPQSLSVRQNTRGVYLSWFQPDERAVAYRVYRNQRLLDEAEHCDYQDSTASYDSSFQYAVAAVDAHGSESMLSSSVTYQTPRPASANLTQLVPLSVSQDRLSLGQDRSATGQPLRVGGQRIYRGLGTVAPSRVVYFLGAGYDLFSGVVGIDDSAGGRGSAVFRVIADGQTLFTSPVMRGGQPPITFAVRVRGKLRLELVASDADDGSEFDYADWGNPYLRVFRGEIPPGDRSARRPGVPASQSEH